MIRFLLVAGVVLAATAPVNASNLHLRLVKSEPGKGDTVTSPKLIRLWFSLKPALPVTGIRVLDASRREMPVGQVGMIAGTKDGVEAAVTKPLAPGRYTVSWKTASSDMHPVKGEFAFVVR